MVPFAPLLAALERIPDPRRAQGRRYPLPHLLLFSVLAVLAGVTSYRGIVTFLDIQRDWLGEVYGGRLRRAPAVNTLRNLFLALDPQALESAFRPHARQLGRARTDAPCAVALDGKTLRRSFDRLHDRAAAHVLGAFAANAALILGHQEVPEVPAEVEAVQAMIHDLGLTGVVFAVDALHCQKNLRPGQADRQCLARSGQGRPAAPASGPRRPVRRARAGRPRRDGRPPPPRPPRAAPGRGLRARRAPAGLAGYLAAVARITRRTWLPDSASGLWWRREERACYAGQVRLDTPTLGRLVRGHTTASPTSARPSTPTPSASTTCSLWALGNQN